MHKRKHNRYMELIAAMLRSGLLGYGGGPSVIPLLRHEAVIRYNWLGDDEFGEVLALANTLPGPILTKLSAYLGYRVKGIAGAIVAVLAQVLPTALAMIALMSVVQILNTSSFVVGMIAAVTPVITVMLGLMAYEFAERAMKGLGKWVGSLLFLIAFLLLQMVQLHPGFIVAFALLYGAFHYKLLVLLGKRGRRGEQ
jgi:chromate transporter